MWNSVWPCWRPLSLQSMQPGLEIFRWVDADVVNKMRQQNVSCIEDWEARMPGCAEPRCWRTSWGGEREWVKKKKQMLSRQEFPFILFTHLAVEETPWQHVFSADSLFISLAVTNTIPRFQWRELMSLTAVSLRLQLWIFFSLPLKVAFNETEAISGWLTQIKQPAEFSFLCQSP